MSWQPTFPAAVDALIAALNAELAGIVHDGAELRQSTGNEVVFVGYDGTEDANVAAGSFTRNGLAVSPDRESYSIQCAVIVVNGANSVLVSRARTFELLAAVGRVLSTDKTLGGAVMSASLGEWAFQTEQSESGAVATLSFGVDIDAYTQM